jgi:Uma2 family endonuclease
MKKFAQRVTDMNDTDKKTKYTYADYYSWNDGKRWELCEGAPVLMSPAPGRWHQKISGSLFLQFGNFLLGKPCEVYDAPFDVRLNPESGDDIVCQPDIAVVCDQSKLNDKCCVGAPDLIVEILSPSTARHDRLRKFNLYLKAGVREYWIVDPDEKTVQVCILENSKYVIHMYDETAQIPVSVLDGCVIDMKAVFPEPYYEINAHSKSK